MSPFQAQEQHPRASNTDGARHQFRSSEHNEGKDHQTQEVVGKKERSNDQRME